MKDSLYCDCMERTTVCHTDKSRKPLWQKRRASTARVWVGVVDSMVNLQPTDSCQWLGYLHFHCENMVNTCTEQSASVCASKIISWVVLALLLCTVSRCSKHPFHTSPRLLPSSLKAFYGRNQSSEHFQEARGIKGHQSCCWIEGKGFLQWEQWKQPIELVDAHPWRSTRSAWMRLWAPDL